ncbi:Transposon TX1 uncharacterized 149 kDa protein [Vitis vinifera]|uniref:Transposon TX1 uncharacterized 149 kDa protein n=1 Tax=Vitis vinifera TaxID=29760 RepID=A0A438CAN3_VITVI|nr:Transposon TX1 uncharacterized 149 kDa protein [Vitis vinifera]
MSRGGRRRFTVESKAFDLVIDEVGGKLRGCIWERCKGLSSWIRFGDASLSSLLVGVESCCRDRDDSNWSLAWEEEGRKYRLERRTNEAGRFILCSVRDLEAKRFCLIFPEGKRLSGGWNTLDEKLREVGVAPFRGVKDPLSLEVWLEAGRRVKPGRLEQLGRCLVGRWDKVENHPPALDYLKNWAVHAWLLKGKLDIAVMGGGLILFEFELMSEAERVLARGKRKVLGSVLMMERWHPEVGCFSNGAFASEVWVRVVGLPFTYGIESPVVVGIPTLVLSGGAGGKWSRKGDAVAEEVAGSGSRNECRGGVLVKVGQPKEQRGVVEPPCGSSSKGVSGCPYELAERGPGKEVTDGEDSCGISSRGGGKLANMGGFKSGPAACVFGPDWEAQARSGIGEGGLKSEYMGAQMLGQIGSIAGCKGRPDMGFEPVLGGLKENRAFPCAEVGGMEIRASMEASGGQVKEDGGIACILGGDWRDSEYLMAKARARMTEEALSAEASRYEPVIDVLGGDRVHFSSPTLSGCDRAMVVGGVRGPVVIDEGVGYQAPLRALLTDGSPWETGTEGGKNRGFTSKEREDLEEEEDQGSGWDDSSLAKFSKTLGFSTVGVEGEVLKLLLRLKSRRDQEAKMSQMTLGVVRSLGVGRFLDWGVLMREGQLEGCWFFGTKECWSWKGWRWVFSQSPVGSRTVKMGGPFTWSGGLNNQAMTRLDRFLVSEDWESHFKGAVKCTLPRPVSDHFPILLDGGGVRRVSKLNGSFSFILAEKLKALKAILKLWNKDVFGQVDVNKKVALDKVNFWDGQEKLRPLSLEELEARKVAKGDFEKWALMEEVSWRQKSREVWLREGIETQVFFHKMANSHRRRNCLSKIKVDGVWLTEEQEIKRGVVRAFKDQLTDPGGWHPSMEGLDFNRIGDEDAARLEEVFSEEEVLKALSDLNGDKAPGPDGFPIRFWQFCWDVAKEEIMGFLLDFHECGRFVRSLNSTFLVLIPKKPGAEDLRDFRPISLVGGLYKLLAKVLANRLKKVVGKVVSSAQNAFVEGGQILDAALIANEAIDSLLKRNESGHEIWGEVDWVDILVHLYSNVLSIDQWHLGRLLQQFKGAASGGPPIPLPFCDRNGGP